MSDSWICHRTHFPPCWWLLQLLLTTNLLLITPQAGHAATVTLTLPDDTLHSVISDTCLYGLPGVWEHCEKPENGSYKTDQEKVVWMLDKLLRFGSLGHDSLESIKATIAVQYDQPR